MSSNLPLDIGMKVPGFAIERFHFPIPGRPATRRPLGSSFYHRL
jgi:hypothetical protein